MEDTHPHLRRQVQRSMRESKLCSYTATVPWALDHARRARPQAESPLHLRAIAALDRRRASVGSGQPLARLLAHPSPRAAQRPGASVDGNGDRRQATARPEPRAAVPLGTQNAERTSIIPHAEPRAPLRHTRAAHHTTAASQCTNPRHARTVSVDSTGHLYSPKIGELRVTSSQLPSFLKHPPPCTRSTTVHSVHVHPWRWPKGDVRSYVLR